MDIKITDNIMTAALNGRIDSTNASGFEEEIMKALKEEQITSAVFDASELEYISSAGLRVLMKIRKLIGNEVSVNNVSRDVYDIFETTGFTELLKVQKAYREVSVKDCEIIGKGFFGTVYRLDAETIVKVYKGKDSIPMILNEQKMARKAFINGIPTAISYDIVRVGEDYGSVFELLNAKTLNDIVIDGEKSIEDIVSSYVDMICLVHSTSMKEGELPDVRETFSDYLEVIEQCLNEHEIIRYRGFISSMPYDPHVTHGDIQMKNVMVVDGEMMLIDMDTLCLGNPIFDLQALYVTYQLFSEDEPDNTMNFLGISKEKADRIWELIIEDYYEGLDKETIEVILRKIKLVSYIRFLYLIMSTDLKKGELGELRIKHTKEHISELIDTVEDLIIPGSCRNRS
ncbi:MAG: anti-sigma factor antagonist [Lachnospiraceae bacterium]|nr:anti-sigma factor antagonist [Lachnospiraceae bacterium]